MPIYHYKCNQHGLFYQLATMKESAQPCACPNCGELSARIIMLAPEVLAIKKANRTAYERNEKSAHVPIFSTVDYRKEQQARRGRKHGKGCGCGDKPIRKSALTFTADGKKMFLSMRPWMISH